MLNRQGTMTAGAGLICRRRPALRPAATLDPVPSDLTTTGEALTSKSCDLATTISTSSGRASPIRRAPSRSLTTAPWTVKVDSLAGKPGDYALDETMRGLAVEERVYRMRCVGLVDGHPLGGRAARRPARQGRAAAVGKYVAFETLVRPRDARAGYLLAAAALALCRGPAMDEATNPLLMAVGTPAGRCSPNRTRAPPPRGAVEIRLQEHQVDRRDHPDQLPTSRPAGAVRIRLLRQREPQRGPPALEPGAERTAHRRRG